MAPLPMHPRSLEASLDDGFIGAFYHTGTQRPALLSKQRILHQRFSMAQVSQVSPCAFSLDSRPQVPISHTQQGTRPSMFEDMQTPLEHLSRKMHARLLESF